LTHGFVLLCKFVIVELSKHLQPKAELPLSVLSKAVTRWT